MHLIRQLPNLTFWHHRMRVRGYEGLAKANEISVNHPLDAKRAYGEKKTIFGEKSMEKKQQCISG